MAVAQEFASMANRLVVRLAGRLNEADRLSEITFAVIIGFTVIGAGFAVMKEMEARYHHFFYETDISFELTTPPPPQAPVVKKPVAMVAAPRHEMMLQGNHATKPKTENAIASKPETPSQKNLIAAKSVTVAPSAEPTAAPITNQTAASVQAPASAAALPTSSASASSSTTAASSTQAPSSESASAGTASGTYKLQPDMTSVAGGDFGAQHVAPLAATAPRMGNIRPYKIELLKRLTENWHPTKDCGRIVLELTIAHDGTLLGDKVVVSSGSANTDKDALAAVEATRFAPLPEWFKGDHLIWKLDLSTINNS